LKEEAKIHFYTMLLGIPWKVVKDWWIELSLPCHLPGYRVDCPKTTTYPEPTSRFLWKPSFFESKTTNFTIYRRFKSTNGMPSLGINVWWFWVLSLVDISIAWCGFGDFFKIV
jgi:hypothetical protein